MRAQSPQQTESVKGRSIKTSYGDLSTLPGTGKHIAQRSPKATRMSNACLFLQSKIRREDVGIKRRKARQPVIFFPSISRDHTLHPKHSRKYIAEIYHSGMFQLHQVGYKYCLASSTRSLQSFSQLSFLILGIWNLVTL